MGCVSSSPALDENDPLLQSKRVNDAIEQSLLLSKQNEKNQIKLLLLGAGESGKSTVLKQMKLMHQGGFTHQERLQYSQVIWVDAIQSMKILIIQARKFGIVLDCDKQNNPLNTYKQIILKSRALEQIDTSVAGGTNFLNDYVVKYSEGSKNKRRLNSTGRAGNVWDNPNQTVNLPILNSDQQNVNQEISVDEISNGLLETSTTLTNSKEITRDKIAVAIKMLWENDSGIGKCFARSNEFHLEGSAAYYFENIDHFSNPNYLCTNEDILRGRIKTTGITETNFNINSFKFKVLDAGGQRSERKKWIHCFQDITAVLFVLAISEYDQMLFEDERVNRIHEAIMLFDSLCNSKWFHSTPFILFLNKIDIFETKIKKSPIRKYFPDYNGKSYDVEEATKYFEQIFLGLNRFKKPIYVHRTCATDTKSMQFVLTAVTDLIVQQNLKKSGIL